METEDTMTTYSFVDNNSDNGGAAAAAADDDATGNAAVAASGPTPTHEANTAAAVDASDHVTANDEGTANDDTELSSIESRKRKLIRELQDHPERFWPSSVGAVCEGPMENNDIDDENHRQSQHGETIKQQAGTKNGEEEPTEDSGISPTLMDKKIVKKIRIMAESLFNVRERSDDSTNTAAGGVGLNASSIELLERIQKQLEQMSSSTPSQAISAGDSTADATKTAEGQSKDGDSSRPDGQTKTAAISSITSEPSTSMQASPNFPSPPSDGNITHRQLGCTNESGKKDMDIARKVLGWLCVDLKRVVQAAMNVDGGTVDPKSRGEKNTDNNNNKADAVRAMVSPLQSLKAPPTLSRLINKDYGIRSEGISALLCDETMPASMAVKNNTKSPSVLELEDMTALCDSREENDVSQLMCQEIGVFDGDNIQDTQATKTNINATANGADGAARSSLQSSSDKLDLVHLQRLAIIRETTRLIRLKTIDLTKRRIEGQTKAVDMTS